MKPLYNKICLITGGTSGIGKASAKLLAELDGIIILVGRNEDKCQKTVQELKQQTGNPGIHYLVADLSSQAAIRQLAAQFCQHYDRLDVLINNAGVYLFRRLESPEGLELTFAVNHLAYFLLSNLLLDELRASEAARVINVASGAHHYAKLNFDDLQHNNSFDKLQVYGQSKLANIMFSYELARRLQNSNITVNAMNPGGVATNLGRQNSELRFWLRRLIRREQSPKDGARTVVYLASSPKVFGLSGLYFENMQPIRSSAASYDEVAAKRLWDISADLCGLSKNQSA